MSLTMLLVTTPTVPGYRFDAVIGMVASTVCNDPEQSMLALWQECVALGANAVVGVQIALASHPDGQSMYASVRPQCVATGTAVVVAPLPEGQEGWTRQSAANVLR